MFWAAHRSSSGALKLCLQPLVYIPMWWPAVVQPGQRPVTTWVYKAEAANTVWSSWWWAVCRLKHVEPSVNFGIINSITRLHLVGYFYWRTVAVLGRLSKSSAQRATKLLELWPCKVLYAISRISIHCISWSRTCVFWWMRHGKVSSQSKRCGCFKCSSWFVFVKLFGVHSESLSTHCLCTVRHTGTNWFSLFTFNNASLKQRCTLSQTQITLIFDCLCLYNGITLYDVAWILPVVVELIVGRVAQSV